MIDRAECKYVFLDVIEFTKNNIDDQYKIIQVIEGIIKGAINDCYYFGRLIANVRYLPTGDGMCIVLVEDDKEDRHILIALAILKRIYEHNKIDKVKFKIRIGINENKDISYLDINGKRNYAGRGINMAQRVMSVAEGNQIFVGSVTYERLVDTKEYKGKFRKFNVEIHHGEKIPVYQFIDKTQQGLDCSTPGRFTLSLIPQD